MSASSTLGRTGLLLLALAAVAPPAAAQQWEVPLTEYGHPDLQGNWINATLTPLERSPGLEPVYTRAEVEAIEQREEARVARGYEPSDPDRPPPEAGNLGAYNQVYLDRGDQIAVVNGEPRTSLITFPPDGRMPPLTPEGQARKEAYEAFQAQFGAYDHPELRPPAERCVVYYGSSDTGVLGTPMTPTNGYNNNFTIVQNEDHVLIHAEMIHDVRIVRLGEPGTRADARAPLPADQRPWFGESWGRWEGETLVVETTDVDYGFFNASGIPLGPDASFEERFALNDNGSRLEYTMIVTDPATFTAPVTLTKAWEWRPGEQVRPYDCRR